MPYIQEGMTTYTEDELGLGGVKDWLKTAGSWMKTGARQQLLYGSGAGGMYGGMYGGYGGGYGGQYQSPLARMMPILLIGGAAILVISMSKKKGS